MKKVILSSAVVIAIAFTSCKNDQNQEDTTTVASEQVENTDKVAETALIASTFGVRGNCGMCKTTIENAANGVDGVASAVWDQEKKKMDVSFDASKTNEMAIQEAVAASGYDTEKVSGNEEAYKNLPGCCQYDHEMAMNRTGENVSDSDNEHTHEEGGDHHSHEKKESKNHN